MSPKTTSVILRECSLHILKSPQNAWTGSFVPPWSGVGGEKSVVVALLSEFPCLRPTRRQPCFRSPSDSLLWTAPSEFSFFHISPIMFQSFSRNSSIDYCGYELFFFDMQLVNISRRGLLGTLCQIIWLCIKLHDLYELREVDCWLGENVAYMSF